MSTQHPMSSQADLAEQAQKRTTVPAAHPHDHDHDHDHEHEHEHGHDHDEHGHDHDHHDHDHAFERPELLRIVLVGVSAAVVWLRLWEPFAAVSVIGVVG